MISDLCSLLEDYLEPEQVADIYQAYLFGAEAHEGQHRMTGEPYIYHPIQVARILSQLHMDHQSIIAAILHDVIEDTPTAKEQLVELFDEEVAELVDGVSKLTHIEFESKAEAQAENFRKMILAMTRDMRVILIKLADRLHNMRTLGIMRPDKKRRIARETLDIYAPIANRLGINNIRLELEDLGFKAMYPNRYRILSDAVKRARGNRKEIIDTIGQAIQARLNQEDLHGRVEGREKHLYSIYKKMRDKHLSFHEVFDVYAFRIIVDRVDTCYRVLGAVHNLYKPIPGHFKDYIAIPKSNGYQSLHTALFSPYGVPIEVQIRTEEMDKVAESGIAAHWLYKSGITGDAGTSAQQRAREWMRELLEMQQKAGNSMEFLENVKIDLFPDEVYVFSPKGEIMELPRGATAVDYAYMVHSDVGNACVAAKIDRRLYPLHTRLHSGQTVEIITAPNARPNPAWLNFVVTAKARSTIRAYLKNMQREDSISLGRRMLERYLLAHDMDCDDLTEAQKAKLLEVFKAGTLEELLEAVGLGNRMPQLIVKVLFPEADEESLESREELEEEARPLFIRGTEGMVVNLAKCCRPIPGDPILGFISAGRGIVIHAQDCKNVVDYRKHPERWVDVQWESGAEGEYPVDLRVEVANRRGVLATVAATISETEANIDNVEMEERDGLHTALDLTVAVRNRQHLAHIMRRLRALESVVRITRRTKG
ncbi:MAG: bifunctional GTP diphosphokinase/guanosine-3',5'-bis pyrophosphate 3'-pyrophosphohydrolase [Gammaproteobacteria bacterium]|nr:bifunctional GTP diphosphokinase/guanosine-3',5'-bis pyrophosphate 3'-pyrophosphohydrolase [Gammaproteobacteria bacterium]